MKTLSVGSVMIDTIAIVDSDRIERMAMNNAATAYLLLEEGRKIEADGISTHVGGAAANTAVCFSRLGHAADILARIGADVGGEQAISLLKTGAVGTDLIQTDTALPTGRSVMVASHERDVSTFVSRGANSALSIEDVGESFAAYDLLHISALSNDAALIFPSIVSLAKAGGAKVSANIGIRQLASRAQEVLEVAGQLDIFSMNMAEAAALMPTLAPASFGMERPVLAPAALPELCAGGFDMPLETFLTLLRRYTNGVILVTHGAAGSFVFSGQELTHIPAHQPDPVEGTAGAGDAFAATFASALCQGESIQAAGRLAAINAASVISHIDTQTGLLTHDALTATARADLPG